MTFLARIFDAIFRRRPRPVPDPTIPAQVYRIEYGDDPQQFIVLYTPERRASQLVPAVEFVHGGGWRRGDAEADNVVVNKVAWLNAQGKALCSISYRLGVDSTPPVDPYTQAQDVAAAFAYLRRNARALDIDPARITRMGHSAGSHLMMLVSTDPDLAAIAGPYLGAVSLDSAALDVVKIMENPRRDPLYTTAFGEDRAYWLKCSPQAQLQTALPPVLLVYSSQRGPANRKATDGFATKARALGTDATVLPVDLSHGEINSTLGLPGAYTDAVDAWMGSV